MFELIIIAVIIVVILKKKKANGNAGGNIGSTRDMIRTAPAPVHRMQKPEHTPAPHNTMPASGSTTAYLNEKARQDAIGHAREEKEEEMRLYKAYGGLKAAERLYEGDSVPQGRRLCVCGYCGAENLLPVMAREQFCCYFCREPLA